MTGDLNITFGHRLIYNCGEAATTTLNPKPLTYNPIPRRYTQTMQSANMIFYVIGAIVIVLFILLLVNMLLMRNKLNRLAKKYKYFMNGEDGGSLELRLSTEVRELREMVSSSENMLHQQELLATMQLSSFQRWDLCATMPLMTPATSSPSR